MSRSASAPCGTRAWLLVSSVRPAWRSLPRPNTWRDTGPRQLPPISRSIGVSVGHSCVPWMVGLSAVGPASLVLGGVGLARLSQFHIGPDIEAGRLVPVLEEFNPGDREDIHAVFLGRGGPLPARVRAFVDFLAEHVRIEG
jgi:DNA-binding transcriptional LysR family regulator